MKVVLNRSVGGFGVSHQILCRLHELGNPAAIEELDLVSSMDDDMMEMVAQRNNYPLFDIERNDPQLIQAVEELHETVPHLEVVEIPDDIEYYIYSNEMGIEYVHEKHRIWPED